jgi:hypothetical protein
MAARDLDNGGASSGYWAIVLYLMAARVTDNGGASYM